MSIHPFEKIHPLCHSDSLDNITTLLYFYVQSCSYLTSVVERLNEIFTVTKRELVPLIQKICKSSVKSAYVVPKPLEGQSAFTVEKQKEMCSEVATAIGNKPSLSLLNASLCNSPSPSPSLIIS